MSSRPDPVSPGYMRTLGAAGSRRRIHQVFVSSDTALNSVESHDVPGVKAISGLSEGQHFVVGMQGTLAAKRSMVMAVVRRNISTLGALRASACLRDVLGASVGVRSAPRLHLRRLAERPRGCAV